MLANNLGGGWEIDVPDTKGDLVNSPVALYDVTITAPLEYSIVTTGTATSSTRTASNQQIHVVSGLQRDFMVVATTLAHVSTTVDGTTLNVYYPNGNVRGGYLALKFARQAVHLYNGMFGQYPYNELDMVAVDAGTFYGVEYPGLLLFDQRLFSKAWFFESIVAHEVAHQWFYNVIGNDVQTHAWVDESFATYAQVLYREKIWGASAATIERTGFVNQYAKLQARNSDGPIEQHMREFTLYSYNVLVYAKAALYLDAVRAQVGPEVFGQAMRDYYAAHRYEVVDGTAFVGAVQSACNCDIQPLYNRWVLGQ
jgi:aminopeptidase N